MDEREAVVNPIIHGLNQVPEVLIVSGMIIFAIVLAGLFGSLTSRWTGSPVVLGAPMAVVFTIAGALFLNVIGVTSTITLVLIIVIAVLMGLAAFAIAKPRN